MGTLQICTDVPLHNGKILSLDGNRMLKEFHLVAGRLVPSFYVDVIHMIHVNKLTSPVIASVYIWLLLIMVEKQTQMARSQTLIDQVRRFGEENMDHFMGLALNVYHLHKSNPRTVAFSILTYAHSILRE